MLSKFAPLKVYNFEKSKHRKAFFQVGGQNYIVFFGEKAHCVYGVSCSEYIYSLALETSALHLLRFMLWIRVLSCFAFVALLALDIRTFLLSCFGDKRIAFMAFLAVDTLFLALDILFLALDTRILSCFADKRIAFMVFLAGCTVSCSGYTYFLALETSILRLWCFLL